MDVLRTREAFSSVYRNGEDEFELSEGYPWVVVYWI